MLPLIDGRKAKEVGRRRCRQHGSFRGPAEARRVVSSCGGYGFGHGALVSKHIIVPNDAGKFELRVVDRTYQVVM